MYAKLNEFSLYEPDPVLPVLYICVEFDEPLFTPSDDCTPNFNFKGPVE